MTRRDLFARLLGSLAAWAVRPLTGSPAGGVDITRATFPYWQAHQGGPTQADLDAALRAAYHHAPRMYFKGVPLYFDHERQMDVAFLLPKPRPMQ